MIKNFILPLVVSILAGLIIWIMQEFITLTFWIVTGIFLITISIVYFIHLFYMYFKIRELGIIRILNKSDKGEGSTKSYLTQANREICFVGIAASKWLNQKDTFEKTIRRICALKGGRIRFLLLNPDSEAAKKLSLSNNEIGNEEIVKSKILASVNYIGN